MKTVICILFLAAAAPAGILRVATYPLRVAPVKLLRPLTYPVRHPVKTIRPLGFPVVHPKRFWI